jgi:hypothetical protein
MKLIVAFHTFVNVPNDENLGACVAFVIKHFCVSPSTRFTAILDSVGASEWDAA